MLRAPAIIVFFASPSLNHIKGTDKNEVTHPYILLIPTNFMEFLLG